MSQPAPTASGTLAATPLGHLLVYALDRRLTGTIVFEDPEHKKHAVYLSTGAPAAARSATVIAPLGELAVARGILSPSRLEPALQAAREGGKRLGELLLEWVVVDEAALDALLREQVARRVKELRLLPPATAYGFYEGINFLERAGGPKQPCAPLALILRVMRLAGDGGRSAETLARLGGSVLRFHADAPLARFDFEPGEQAVVDVLRAKPQTLAELTNRGLLEPSALERLLYTLFLLKHFDTGSGSQPIGAERRSVTPAAPVPAAAAPSPRTPPAAAASPAPPTPSPSPSPSPSPAPSEDPFRLEAEQRAAADKQSFYEILGVPTDAPTPAIAAAYFQLAKRWHPDRLAPEHADIRDLAMSIFARIGEAHRVLSDAERRTEYDATLKDGGSEESAEEQEQVQRLLRASTNFQKAQVLLKRNNLPAAEEAARLALEDAPEEADHIALVAWLRATKPDADVPGAFKEIDRASKLEPANLRVRWFRGQLLKRLGKERQALEDFRMIVEKDPRHVDAQRELRLHEMARGQGQRKASDAPGARQSDPHHPPRTPVPATGEKGGFFGKLFKK
ncbi:MAG TPA: DnaJ domain-containing protein [Polyangiaceae bacterium]|nr:DnaJ domain-containing protein [Polyangiaceae bacterium]